jgi:hypothetical protein
MTGVYRPRHPEWTVLYRVLSHYFSSILAEYESRFEREYGYFRPVVKEVVERYLDCGNPRCGFALAPKRRVGQTKRHQNPLSRLPGGIPADVFL